jgi:D-alanine-D-alanine ligase
MIQNVVGYLELLKVQYTGCNPRGLMLAHDKALSKKILAFHRIPVPQFAVFPLNRRIRRGSKLKFPLLVKSVTEEGSVGISQASVVYDEEKLIERIEFIHRNIATHAIAEEYIDGRDIYVGVIGNNRLKTMPPWELIIKHLPEGSVNIATLKVKWDLKYQARVGVVTEAAQNLTPEQHRMIEQLSKRIYRLLELSGYARLDFRMREDGKLFLIEANPNPQMREDEDFALSAKQAGITYVKLVNEIIRAGLSYEYVNLP